MTESMSIREFLTPLAEQARSLLDAQTASAWLVKDDRVVLCAATGYDAAINMLQDISYKIGEGITGTIARGTPIRLTSEELRHHQAHRGAWDAVVYGRPDREQNLSLLGVPIRSGDTTLGVLKVEAKRDGIPFTESDQRLLETVADLIATAIMTKPEFAEHLPGAYIFVLMPFVDNFKDIYELGIKATAEKLMMRCERVDEIEFNDTILAEIYAGIQRADLIIADMTGRNPNVFYEVGYAHALSKDVVLLTQVAEDIPFDLKGHNHIVYGNSISTLRNRLERRLNALLFRMRGAEAEDASGS